MFFSSGGVLCSFSIGVQESERQRCRHALTHSSFHVQGETSYSDKDNDQDEDKDKDKDKDMRSHIVLSMFKVKTSSLWFQQDDFFFNHTSMKPWRSEIKCEVVPNLNYGDYGIEIE